MSSVVISGDTSGTVSLTVPAVSGTNTATLPAATGTVMVSGNMPAFSAILTSGSIGLTSNTITKVPLNSIQFDTNSNFNATTNYRFTPTVAGYYQINGTVRVLGTAISGGGVFLYKNGAAYLQSNTSVPPSVDSSIGSISSVIYFNGSTDYVELYLFTIGTGLAMNGSAIPYTCLMSGCLVRAA